VAALLIVFMASTLAVFVTSAWQAQFLYSLKRGKAMSEVLTLGYHAESRLYDVIARFLGGYSSAFTFPINTDETLSDGTKLTTVGVESGDTQTLTVTSKRQFATTKVRLTKVTETEHTTITKPTEIMLSLDCTGSMGQRACPTCATTRMDEQKKAVSDFLDAVAANPGADKIKVGISVFAMSGNWLYTSYTSGGVPNGTAIKPDSGLTVQQMKQAITTNFGHSGETASLACRSVQTYTSVGTGLAFMHDYFKTTAPGLDKIEVLVTDGEPNQRIPYPGCPVDIFCPGNRNYCCPSGSMCAQTRPLSSDGNGWTCPAGYGETTCTPHARDFLRCVLATTDRAWVPERAPGPFQQGVRDPEVDAYVVTVLDNPPAAVTSIMNSFATKYYNSASASDLTGILQDIFQEILTSSTTYTFGKITPTAAP
jgi:hypothetical protein